MTREKQLKLWKDIILQYHMQNNIFSMNLASCPLFENKSIERKLSLDEISELVEHLMATGTWLQL